MAEGFESRVRPLLESQLGAGESLRGLVAATHQKTFSGGLFAIGVTDRRLLLQPLDRKLQVKEPARSVMPEDVVSADVDGAGGGWWTAPNVLLDMSAVALTLRTTDGQKTKLTMMKGGGGVFGGLGGGEPQREGLLALGAWVAEALPGP